MLYVAALAIFLRFYDLPLKPLHHDEGVNAFFLTKLVRPPHTYQYDPANYHGPTLYYFGWLSASVFGLETVALRMVTACAGLAIVLMPLAFRRQLGDAGTLAACALLASSSGAVYYARYFIHESILVCSTLALVIFAISWWRSRSRMALYLAATSAGVMFATKETALIAAVVLAGSAFLTVIATARLAATMTSIDRRDVRMLIEAGIVFVAVALLFYTALFTDPSGAAAAIRTFAIWTKTGTSDHTHAWYSYLHWLAIEDLAVLAAGVVGAGLAMRRLRNPFAVFAAIWACGILAAYSLIPYKTPWLVLNAIAPLSLCAGYAFESLWQQRTRATRVLFWLLLAGATGASTSRAAWLNFWHYDDARSPYVYAHTSREVFGLVHEVESIESKNPGATIAVTSRQYFPLPWYFRNYRAAFYGRTQTTDAPIVIGSLDQRGVLDLLLEPRYERRGPYRLRPGVWLLLYVRRDVKQQATAY